MNNNWTNKHTLVLFGVLFFLGLIFANAMKFCIEGWR
jgi:hypothetical protein